MRDENKAFRRSDDLFSLCGLNCGLCPMRIRGRCGGCRAGSPCAQSCAFVPCSLRHGNVAYCFECAEYPCRRFDGVDLHDSLISHRNQKKDLAQAKTVGIDAYRTALARKRKLLARLLNAYDDGDKDVFFCLAVNILAEEDLHAVVTAADAATAGLPLAAKAAFVEERLRECADRRGIPLELRK